MHKKIHIKKCRICEVFFLCKLFTMLWLVSVGTVLINQYLWRNGNKRHIVRSYCIHQSHERKQKFSQQHMTLHIPLSYKTKFTPTISICLNLIKHLYETPYLPLLNMSKLPLYTSAELLSVYNSRKKTNLHPVITVILKYLVKQGLML